MLIIVTSWLRSINLSKCKSKFILFEWQLLPCHLMLRIILRLHMLNAMKSCFVGIKRNRLCHNVGLSGAIRVCVREHLYNKWQVIHTAMKATALGILEKLLFFIINSKLIACVIKKSFVLLTNANEGRHCMYVSFYEMTKGMNLTPST